MENKYQQEKEDKAFDEMRSEGKKLRKARKDNERNARSNNSLWVWLGVLVLIFIIIYWLFAIGTFGDLADWFNG